MPAPIALFVYKRPDHIRRTVEALAQNHLAELSDLFVFSDGARDSDSVSAVQEVRRYVKTIAGFQSITIDELSMNAGLANSIVRGVTQVCEKYGRVIVLEDDLVTSPWFLTYMNDALELYNNDEKVASVHGYCFPSPQSLPETFFLRGADCWGWATWSRAWYDFEQDGAKLLRSLVERKQVDDFDLDGAYPFSGMLRSQIAGENDSWAIRWHASCFLKRRLTLYPGRSLVQNIGNDASGTHCVSNDNYSSTLAPGRVDVSRIDLIPSEIARTAFASFLRRTRRGFLSRMAFRLYPRLGASR
jgi:hypothetical protein